jgi:hypothetical protein
MLNSQPHVNLMGDHLQYQKRKGKKVNKWKEIDEGQSESVSVRSATMIGSIVEIWCCAPTCGEGGWRTSMSVGMTLVPAAMLEVAHTRGASVPSWISSNERTHMRTPGNSTNTFLHARATPSPAPFAPTVRMYVHTVPPASSCLGSGSEPGTVPLCSMYGCSTVLYVLLLLSVGRRYEKRF